MTCLILNLLILITFVWDYNNSLAVLENKEISIAERNRYKARIVITAAVTAVGLFILYRLHGMNDIGRYLTTGRV